MTRMSEYKKGFVLFSGAYPDDMECAKQYCNKYCLTMEDVGIYPAPEGDPVDLLIITKRTVTLEEKENGGDQSTEPDSDSAREDEGNIIPQ